MSRLEELLSSSPVALVGAARRLLALGDRVLATVNDTAQLGTLVAHIGPGSSLAELLATLAAARPSGIAVLSDPENTHAVALALHDGAIVGATGTGTLETLGEWSAEFRRRLLGSTVEATSQFDPARTFVTELVLDALARSDAPGAGFTLIQGPLQWLDEQLADGTAPALQHLLLEHARRSDELPRIASKIGAVDRVVVPLAPPGERAAQPTQKRLLDDEAESGWDFFDDPDPAAEAEWRDARRIFELCDGMATIAEVVERSMLGRFRTLSAMLALVERSHIAFMAHFAELVDGSAPADSFDAFESLDEVG